MTDECECGGSGFRYVTERYVQKHAPQIMPPFAEPETENEEAVNEAVERVNAERRSAYSQSVYPCPIHNTELYDRWRKGTWPRPVPGQRTRERSDDTDEPKTVQTALAEDDWNQRRKDLA